MGLFSSISKQELPLHRRRKRFSASKAVLKAISWALWPKKTDLGPKTQTKRQQVLASKKIASKDTFPLEKYAKWPFLEPRYQK